MRAAAKPWSAPVSCPLAHGRGASHAVCRCFAKRRSKAPEDTRTWEAVAPRSAGWETPRARSSIGIRRKAHARIGQYGPGKVADSRGRHAENHRADGPGDAAHPGGPARHHGRLAA